MQAAIISYAVFTALILVVVIIVFVIVGVSSLREFLHRRRAKKALSGEPPPEV
jgi:hypothetical protein